VQEGETVRRALPLSRRHRLSVALVVAAAFVVWGDAPAVQVGGVPPGPSGHLDPFVPLVGGEYALCHSSCGAPYGIDDLRAYKSLLGARAERFALWAVWDALVHDLYRLDELRVMFGVEPFRSELSIVLEPVLRREAVSGFTAEYSAGFAAVLVAGWRGLAFSLAGEVSEWRGTGMVLVASRAGLDPLSFTAAVCVRDGGVELREVEGELSIEGVVTLRTGYRLRTGDIRCGIGCRRKSILVTARWEHHPVLGGTVYIGMGYVWPR